MLVAQEVQDERDVCPREYLRRPVTLANDDIRLLTAVGPQARVAPPLGRILDRPHSHERDRKYDACEKELCHETTLVEQA